MVAQLLVTLEWKQVGLGEDKRASREESKMSRSDYISIICSVMSLFASIVIAILQIRQSCRMEEFERRQDKRDEKRHDEKVKSQAVSFISKYYADRGLMPLCVMAAMHNDLFYYSREMYREFCCMTREVQNRILEYCELDLRVGEIDRLFAKCINAVDLTISQNFPDDDSPFYENGKYVLRGLERYGSERIPRERIEYRPAYMDGPLGANLSAVFDGTSSYESCMADMLRLAFQEKYPSNPIAVLRAKYKFEQISEIETCQFLTTLAIFLATYGRENGESDKEYGDPGSYDGESIDTMEDLFLLSMFKMYTCLILN